jgi:parallel beta-helix repeat protein
MIGASVFVGIAGQGANSEYGKFPNRVFVLSKGMIDRPDRTLLTVPIVPANDCIWWVELSELGGPAVLIRVSDQEGATLSNVKLSTLGEESEHVSLVANIEYSATFTYIGKCGVTVLSERTLDGPSPLTLRAPISITSNSGFTAANGVVGGSGTLTDPYIIEGWEIRSTDVHCLEVKNTDAYFVIRNCFLHGDLGIFDGYIDWVSDIALTDCNHVVIDNVKAVKNDMGLRLERVSDIRISNSDFSDCEAGVYAYPAWGVTIDKCKVTLSKSHGVYFGTSSNFSVTNCEISKNRQLGIGIYKSVNGVISDNVLSTNGEEGISIWSGSTYIDVTRNTLQNNGMWVFYEEIQEFSTLTIDTTNTINGLPVLFVKNQQNVVVDSERIGELILANCEGVVVRSMCFTNIGVAINMAFVTGCVIDRCSFQQNGRCIEIEDSADILISNCTASVNEGVVRALNTADITVRDCNFTRSEWGTISLNYCIGGIVVSNHLSESRFGVEAFGSSALTITENVIAYNFGDGINFDRVTGSRVYHNNFLGRYLLAQDYMGANQWDNGYPDGGNYWSDYKGHDADKDGIGDTSYFVSSGGEDRYPLMEPWEPAPAAPQYLPHTPIVINGDAGFTFANGVVSGDGSPQSPYIIQGWEINISDFANDRDLRGGIIVSNTLANFIIRNCYVHSGIVKNSHYPAISLRNCSHPLVESDLVKGCCQAITVSSSPGVRVSDCLLEGNEGGISFYEVTDGTIENCRLINTFLQAVVEGSGIMIGNSVNVTVCQTVVTNVTYIGLFASESTDVQFINNTVSNCGMDALRLQNNVTNCHIVGNSLSGSETGIRLWLTTSYYSPDGGVTWYTQDWYKMNDLTIVQNEIRQCSLGGVTCFITTERTTPIISAIEVSENVIADNGEDGIFLMDVDGASISKNTIQGNDRGVRFIACVNSTVYHNNIIANTYQAIDDGSGIWDDGYPSGGNYWSNYAGADANGDGIGDTPYLISWGSQDRYPLMQPWTPGWTGYAPHEPIVIAGDAAFTRENGVVRGNGTAADPYVIEGWEIDAHNSTHGIRIGMTTAYFVVNRVLVYNAGENCGGVWVYDSRNGLIQNVVAHDCYLGIVVISSESIQVGNCLSYSNVYQGVLVADSAYVHLVNNTFKDQMIGVWIGGQGIIDAVIESNTIYNCEMGVYAEFVSTVTISGNSISFCSAAIILGSASDCAISWNIIESCVGPMGAIYLRYDTNCLVEGNLVISTEKNGICVLDSSLITLTNNKMFGGLCGIFLMGFSGSGTDILVTGNTIRDNFYGLEIFDLGSALVYGNDFVNNSCQVSQGNSNVTWDFMETGNYWSDYTGFDANGDGIGDIPYVIPNGGADNYPWMTPRTA